MNTTEWDEQVRKLAATGVPLAEAEAAARREFGPRPETNGAASSNGSGAAVPGWVSAPVRLPAMQPGELERLADTAVAWAALNHPWEAARDIALRDVEPHCPPGMAASVVDAARARAATWTIEQARGLAAQRPRVRPVITANQDSGMVVLQTRAAMADLNRPPVLFRHGGVLSRVGRDDQDREVILPLSPPAIRAELAVRITWVKAPSSRERTEGKSGPPATVPPVAVDDLTTHADQLGEGVPVLDLVVTAPVFAPDGTLVTQPGYHPQTRTWYAPRGRMDLAPVSERPGRDELTAAVRLLLDDYLGDFPFADEASWVHALGCLLLPFTRLMIDGPVPLQCTDASTAGTGKGLLQRALMLPALGGMLPALPGVFSDDAELQKKITTALIRGQQVIRWDNVDQRVDSPVLSSVLTEPVWQDRILGLNRDVEIPVQSIWLMSGNNLQFSQEMSRRVVPVRLDLTRQRDASYAETPWMRPAEAFRHPRLMTWGLEHRAELVHAALTLVRSWLAAGRPDGSRSLGSYEEWARVTGGIVEHATGSAAFLTGLDDLYAEAVSERDEKIGFLQAWSDMFGNQPVNGQQILMSLGHVLPFRLDAKAGARSHQTSIGVELTRMKDQVWGGYQVAKRGRSWVLQWVETRRAT